MVVLAHLDSDPIGLARTAPRLKVLACGAAAMTVALIAASPGAGAASAPKCALLPSSAIAAALGTGALKGPTVHVIGFSIAPESSCSYAVASDPHEVSVNVEAPVTASQFKTSESPLTGYKYSSYTGAGIPGYIYSVPNSKPSKAGVVVLKGKFQITLFASGVAVSKMEALIKRLVAVEK